MTIPMALGIYCAALVAFFLIAPLGSAFNQCQAGICDASNGMIFTIICYLAAGITLNRVVFRQLVEFHPVYNTLENISRYKLRLIAFWPFSYPYLFVQLLVARCL